MGVNENFLIKSIATVFGVGYLSGGARHLGHGCGGGDCLFFRE